MRDVGARCTAAVAAALGATAGTLVVLALAGMRHPWTGGYVSEAGVATYPREWVYRWGILAVSAALVLLGIVWARGARLAASDSEFAVCPSKCWSAWIAGHGRNPRERVGLGVVHGGMPATALRAHDRGGSPACRREFAGHRPHRLGHARDRGDSDRRADAVVRPNRLHRHGAGIGGARNLPARPRTGDADRDPGAIRSRRGARLDDRHRDPAGNQPEARPWPSWIRPRAITPGGTPERAFVASWQRVDLVLGWFMSSCGSGCVGGVGPGRRRRVG